MHRCLRISEVMHLVCTEADRSTALALALTCKAFLDPALDRLWDEINSFGPLTLIACLPAGLVKREGEQQRPVFTRSLASKDLSRYLTEYAHRIRCLRGDKMIYRLLGIRQDTLWALQVATNFKVGALSPRLKIFQWPVAYGLPDAIIPEYMMRFSMYLILFVGQSVESMNIPINTDALKWCSHTIFDTTRRLSRGIRHLKITADVGGLPGLYLTTLPWTSLQTVALSVISLPIVHALCKFPNLRRVEIDDNQGTLSQIQHSIRAESPSSGGGGPPSPPALRVLIYRCSSNSLRHIQGLAMLLVSGAGLKCVKMTTRTHLPSWVCQRVVDTIGDYCNPVTLESVAVHGWDEKSPQYYWKGLDVEDKDQDVNVSPLLKFKALHTVKVHCRGRIRLTHSFVSKMVKSWPSVQHLDFCPTFFSEGQTPGIDHTHLLEIVEGFRSLRHLGLRFDTTQLTG